MSAAESYEAGLRPNRTEYITESTHGTPPTDPSWILFSDAVIEFDPEPGADISTQRVRGSPDPQGAFAGTESPTVTVVYFLQQKSASGNTFQDGSSNPNDAATDGMQRDADNRLQNTHTVVDRYEQSDLDAANTVNGSTSLDTRQYWVCKGGYIDEVTITGDPSDGLPIQVEVTYEFEKVRHYQLDQPSSGTTIDVVSTNANDSGTVTLEDEGANTTEDVTISANGTASSTETFDNLDAVEIDSEQPGDITISDGTNDLMVIKGQDSYDHGEGDLGIPALGTGSHGSAIGQSYELYHDDQVEQPDGTTVADHFETTEITFSNNVDGTEQAGTPRRALSAGDREIEFAITVFGESEVHDRTVDALTTATDNVRWEMEGGTIQGDSAYLAEDPDTDAFAASESKAMTSLSFLAQGLTLST